MDADQFLSVIGETLREHIHFIADALNGVARLIDLAGGYGALFLQPGLPFGALFLKFRADILDCVS